MNYKITETGLDTRHLSYDSSPLIGDSTVDYLLTSISANNDFLLPGLVKDNDGPGRKDIILVIESLKNIEYVIKSHLSSIGAQYITTLLLSPKCEADPDSVLEIKNLLSQGLVINVGIHEPNTKEDIIKWGTQIDINSVSLPISPLEFNHDLINWCHEHVSEIIGLNPFGGYLSAPRNIESFTVQYLLNFAATYADIVILSGRDVVRSVDEADYLKTLVGKESSSMYLLKKNISKPVKPLKQFTYTSIKVGEDIEVPYVEPQSIIRGDTELTLGGPKIKMPEKQIPGEEEDLEKIPGDGVQEISNLLQLLDYEGLSQGEALALSRYKVLEYLRLEYLESKWSYSIAKIGDSVILFELKNPGKISGFLWWTQQESPQTKTFILCGISGNYQFIEKSNEVD